MQRLLKEITAKKGEKEARTNAGFQASLTIPSESISKLAASADKPLFSDLKELLSKTEERLSKKRQKIKELVT